MKINYDAYAAIGGHEITDFRGQKFLDPDSIFVNGTLELEEASGLLTVSWAAGNIGLSWSAENRATVRMEGTRSQVIIEAPNYYERDTPLAERRGAANARLGQAKIVELSNGGRLWVDTELYRLTPQNRDRIDLAESRLTSDPGRSYIDRVTSGEAEAERVITGIGTFLELPKQDAALLARLALNPTVEIL